MQFKGIPVSKGKFSGKICLVHDTNGFSHCQVGNVPLLIKVKPNAALVNRSVGILAVHGGITSHAAIVARESNKPAVVGLSEEILKHVKDGDEVSVDGETGIVEIR